MLSPDVVRFSLWETSFALGGSLRKELVKNFFFRCCQHLRADRTLETS